MRLGLFLSLLLGSLAHGASSLEILNSAQLSNRLQQLPADFVLIQLWSPICAPCQEEVKELNGLLQAIERESRPKLSILGIPMHTRKKEAEAFIDHFQLRYEQLWPNADLKARLAKEQQVPWTLLLDKNRRVVKEWTGQLTANQVMTEINRADYNRKHELSGKSKPKGGI